jgi:hypothetical protein
MDKLVSIIVPFHNDGAYLEQAIQSIFDQTYHNKEIIVVDDGSDEKNKEVLKQLEPKVNHIITQDNQGPSVARNVGIKAAKGGYILTLDADDYFEQSFIQKAVGILDNNPKVGLATCHARTFNTKGTTGEIIACGGEAYELLIRNGALASCMFRKEAWREVKGYDENMLKGYEDWDFNISLVKTGWKIHVINEYLFNYRQKKRSRNEIADSLYKYDLLTFLYQKHKDVFIQNYDQNILHLFRSMKKLEKEKIKIGNTSTYRLGDAVLRPIKFLAEKRKKFF